MLFPNELNHSSGDIYIATHFYYFVWFPLYDIAVDIVFRGIFRGLFRNYWASRSCI